jgi:integrase
MDAPLPPDFDRFLIHLRRNERRAPKTIAVRTSALRHLALWCRTNDINPLGVTERDLLDWQASLSYTDATMHSYTAAVRRLYRYLASRAGGRVLTENPAEELPSVRVITPQIDAIEDAELELALRAAEHDPELYTWLLLEAGTGIRPCQIASLTRQRVRYQPNGRAELTVTGKGRTMTVVAGPDIAAELRRWTRDIPGALWINGAGRPVTPGNITKRINRHLKDLGIEATSHSLRRWFGKQAHLLTGNDVRTVMELLGHSSPTTTMRYIPVSQQGRVDVADTLSERLTRKRRAS